MPRAVRAVFNCLVLPEFLKLAIFFQEGISILDYSYNQFRGFTVMVPPTDNSKILLTGQRVREYMP